MESFASYMFLITGLMFSWLTLALFAVLQVYLSTRTYFRKGFIVPSIYILYMVLTVISGVFTSPTVTISVKNISPLGLIFCIDGAAVGVFLLILLICRIWLKRKKDKISNANKIDLKDL